MKGARTIWLKSGAKSVPKRYGAGATRLFEEIRAILKARPKGKILFQVAVSAKNEPWVYAGLAGLLKTASLENPNIKGQLIETEEEARIEAVLEENARRPTDKHIRYRDGERLVARYEEVEATAEKPAAAWKDNGVYLIIGGAGGLGLLFAKEIAGEVKNPVVVLAGRSGLTPEKKARIEALGDSGATVEYRRADISRKKEAEDLIKGVEKKYGGLNGVLHAAGIVRDNIITKKTKEEFEKTLAPKVAGLVNLDEASAGSKLDFFVLFSSIAGAMGNAGQADYACANAFMDAYAEHRAQLEKEKKRGGKTLSIDWPLWKEGGMRLDKDAEKALRSGSGVIPMRTETGIGALRRGLASDETRIMAAEGALARMRRTFAGGESEKTDERPRDEPVENTPLYEKVKRTLTRRASKLLKVPEEEIDAEVELNEYGFDSITLTEFANALNEEYGLDLTPTLFFEYPTIGGLAKHLVVERQDIFASRFPTRDELKTIIPVPREEVKATPMARIRRARVAPALTPPQQDEPVAIVGISGAFPGAKNIEEFWSNLLEGKRCVTEIPGDRWDWRAYYGDPTKDENKTTVKWGGFIE
ncbi:MAG: SDR family NAD(P)-dependent oxidoreductase, partial [Desulfobacterales bacterium]|nr:SDR family NAD(P)-dependent oxidoreductase [Desulfobacterales bacterium]